MPTREIYWNIQGIWIMYAAFAVTVAILGYGIYRQYRMVARGKPENRFDHPELRWEGVWTQAMAQMRSLRDRYSGTMHLMFFWGFIILFMGTVVVFIDADFGIPIMRGDFYLYFQSLTLDILGVVAIVGLLMAIYKRYGMRPDRLLNPPIHRALLDDGIILGLFLVSVLLGFVIEGLRIAGTSDPWAAWSPVGNLIAGAISAMGIQGAALTTTHRVLWWVHMVLAFVFIAYIPFSKLRHMAFTPLNIYFRSLQPMGQLKPIDIETAETLGAPKFSDFTWKQLLDTVSCMECGRCQAACPAYNSGQPLSPKAVILDLRNKMFRTRGPLAATGVGNLRLLADRPAAEESGEAPTVAAVTPEALWSCVTCGACMERCPVLIEHVPSIVDMRRYLVMEQAEYPELMQEALTSLEARGHPFRGATASRTDWCEGLGVKVVGESGPAEWLYWVGCATALDDRNQKIARAFARLLQRAGVDFAILGEEEQCNGDPARRIGNEYLYQMMAQANVETLNRYGVKKIITTCPHCFNTFANEYPQFGGNYEVAHHTQLLDQLVREGRLVADRKTVEGITFHDSCYMARFNGVVQEPRRIIDALPGAVPVEVEKRGAQTFCCGGGGGHLWFEEYGGRRINHERADQLLATGAGTIGSSCPFCMIMLTDGVRVRAGERDVTVKDVAELLEEATRPAGER